MPRSNRRGQQATSRLVRPAGGSGRLAVSSFITRGESDRDGPTMFHGRVAVLPVVAMVAAIQEGQFGFNLSRCLLRDSNSSYIRNSGRARFGRAARAPRTTRSLN